MNYIQVQTYIQYLFIYIQYIQYLYAIYTKIAFICHFYLNPVTTKVVFSYHCWKLFKNAKKLSSYRFLCAFLGEYLLVCLSIISLESEHLPFQEIGQRAASFSRVVSVIRERVRCKKTSLEKEEHNWKNRTLMGHPPHQHLLDLILVF